MVGLAEKKEGREGERDRERTEERTEGKEERKKKLGFRGENAKKK